MSALRIDPLCNDEQSQLDTQGYVCLGRLLSDEQLHRTRARLDELLQEEGDQGGSELYDSPYIRHPKEAGADRLANLVNKGAVFDLFYTHPRLLGAVAHVLGNEFRLSSLNFRAARAGAGEQKLHADWHVAVQPHDFRVCNSIWLLDDFTPENGATRYVPGSHLLPSLPEEALADPWATLPQQELLTAPAGTVVVFNAHLWHGGTTNHSRHPRRAIHSYFCRADQPQQTDQNRFLADATASRLSPAILRLLGIRGY